MENEKRGRGRPEIPDDEKKSNRLVIRLSESDRELIDAVAEGKTSDWARNVLLRAARRRQNA